MKMAQYIASMKRFGEEKAKWEQGVNRALSVEQRVRNLELLCRDAVRLQLVNRIVRRPDEASRPKELMRKLALTAQAKW